MIHRPTDLAGGVFWTGAGLVCLAVLAFELLTDGHWHYYHTGGYLLPGAGMLAGGALLLDRAFRPRKS